MNLRKIKLSILFLQGFLYRIFVVICLFLLVYLTTGKLQFAIKASIAWGIVNMLLYYVYHYIFLSIFKYSVPQKQFTLWFTGLPCSGKSTLADAVAVELKKLKIKVERLDGDIVRNGLLSNDLGFSEEDRNKNLNRVTFVSKLLSRNGIAVLASFVSPYKDTRYRIRNAVTNFIEVFVYASPEECARRDVKGMWKMAKEGKIKGFTGYDAPYEPAYGAEIYVNTELYELKESVERVMAELKRRKLI